MAHQAVSARDLRLGLSCIRTVSRCFSELCKIQEHDRETSKEAEETQEELAVAMEEAEESAK